MLGFVHRRVCASGVAALALLLSTVIVFAQTNISLRHFLAAYRCNLVDRLERIYESGDPSDPMDRFIAVTVPRHPHGYVQCMFYDHQTKLLCEASSGYHYDKKGAPRTFWQSPETIAALASLGFSTDDSEGNFRVDFDVATPPDLNAIADLILSALHDGYGARAETNLRFNAPFAPRATSKCIPVS
jgi:hypothetical protein